MRKGFKGLTEVAALTDAQARSLVLGNWHKLNAVLRTKPGADEVRRLLYLELAKGAEVRGNFVVRLRSALAGAAHRVAVDAVTSVVAALRDGERPERVDLLALGLDARQARALSSKESR